ncbi:MAG: hypothetical protein EPO24_02450 [Bacteroidetes bacterium]|nr:MAG: hypothetical protein EPO24_02450 [Bacteroidota bacterium]
MLKPRTDKGTEFNKQCMMLAESLTEQRTANEKDISREQSSKAVQTFFEFIQRLPDELATQEERMTALFEIDRALSGAYGCTLFISSYSNDPTKELLRDLGALWQRYFLIGGLTRTDPANGAIPGTCNFFDEWLSIENVGREEKEYDRIVSNISKMLNRCKNLNVTTKILLLSFMGEIAKWLDFRTDRAREYLVERHEIGIRERTVDLTSKEMGEILLCFNILSKQGVEATGIEREVLDKAIRYWCYKDEFLDGLFRTWGWHWQNDYSSPLAMGYVFKLKQSSALYRTWDEGTEKLGVDISFLEFKDYIQKNTAFAVFKPMPVFMFGNSNSGKTSYLTAFCYDVSERGSSDVILGRELLAQYNIAADVWKQGNVSPTVGSPRSYTFGKDLKHLGFETFDYGGKEVEPSEWEPQLQESIGNARGLMFFLDDEDYYRRPERLRKLSGVIAYILAAWMARNASTIHVPIAIVLTKADLVFGESLKDISRSWLIDSKTLPGLIENYIPERFASSPSDVKTAYNRLRDCLLRDKMNNAHPLLQDILQNLLDNFSQVFNPIFNLTYHYQIFLTASVPPRYPKDTLYPWGVSQPMMWMMETLERFRLRESIVRFDRERKGIENEITMIQEDLRTASRLSDEIEFLGQQKEALLSKRFVSIRKDELDSLDQQIQNKEKNFLSVAQRYAKDAPAINRNAYIALINQEIAKKEELLKELRDKREEFDNLL